MKTLIVFIAGMCVGATLGILWMALAIIAKRSDERMEEADQERGGSDAEAAVGFLLLVLLVWLGLWWLSGWELP